MTSISLSLSHSLALPTLPSPVFLNFSLIYGAFDYELKPIANAMLLVGPLIAIFD